MKKKGVDLIEDYGYKRTFGNKHRLLWIETVEMTGEGFFKKDKLYYGRIALREHSIVFHGPFINKRVFGLQYINY